MRRGTTVQQQIFLTPLSSPNNDSKIGATALGSLVEVIILLCARNIFIDSSLYCDFQNLQYFCGKEALTEHLREHPWLLERFPALWERLKAKGWELVDGSAKDIAAGRSAVYQLKAIPASMRQWGFHKFASQTAMMKYIHRFALYAIKTGLTISHILPV